MELESTPEAGPMGPESSPEARQEAGRDEGEPAGKKWRLLCEEFSSVASCSVSVARRCLAENDWEMERALNAYFEPQVEEGALKRRPETASEPGNCVDLTNEETTDSVSSKTSTSENLQQEDGSVFSFITWNIDGLDPNNLQERIRGVCSCLALYSPDVIFLQEVIPPYYSYLKKKASSYEIITDSQYPTELSKAYTEPPFYMGDGGGDWYFHETELLLGEEARPSYLACAFCSTKLLCCELYT
ncbi:TRAF and TNF receptor-associated protein [Pteropus alecto]|uniref:Tyrosyl-DNA phosphodiesterase 2 n=1 Tax=Pteropus alecto TaxID=9402 RepID=L5K5P3_PTEAL|nr:TRAF and TNF receptor-associated protein [Pteropus alecto]